MAFSWVEWPDRATRDAAMKKMVGDPRMDPSTPGNPPMPFDGKRMIFGGFEQVVEVKSLNGVATLHLDVGCATAGVWRTRWAPRQVVPGQRASCPFRLQLVPHAACDDAGMTDFCRAPISGQRMSAQGRNQPSWRRNRHHLKTATRPPTSRHRPQARCFQPRTRHSGNAVESRPCARHRCFCRPWP